MNVPKQPSRKWKMVRDQAFAALVACAPIFMPTTGAAEDKSPEPKAASTSQQQAAAKSLAKADNSATKSERPSGPQEGIKVHGRWVVEVRNLDGSMASRSEFENALETISGASFLAGIMGRAATVNAWRVFIDGNPAPCPGSDCTIAELGTESAGFFPNLKVTVSGPSLVLSGVATVVNNNQLNKVSTGVSVCAPGVSPSACFGAPIQATFLFSSHTLTSPISVSAGQLVQVTVTFSFS